MSEIISVKLIKDGKKVDIGFPKIFTIPTKGKPNFQKPVHEDFKKEVQSLACDLAYLTHSEYKQKDSPEFISLFTVTGYSIGGKEDSEGIVITGYKKVDHGTVILNSPFVLIGAEPGSGYINMDKVLGKIKKIENEADQYLHHQKYGEEVIDDDDDDQLEMFDDDGNPVTHAQIANPVKKVFGKEIPEADKDAMERVANDGEQPKKKRGRKVKQSAETPSGEIPEEA